jgi:hypothetical protein
MEPVSLPYGPLPFGRCHAGLRAGARGPRPSDRRQRARTAGKPRSISMPSTSFFLVYCLLRFSLSGVLEFAYFGSFFLLAP